MKAAYLNPNICVSEQNLTLEHGEMNSNKLDITIRAYEDIFDPLIMGQHDVVHQLLKRAEVATTSGQKVIVVRTSQNAPNRIIATLTAPEHVQEWRRKLDEIRKIIAH